MFLIYASIRQYARWRGATVGANSIIKWGLARKSKRNLIIGSDVIIDTINIDLRGMVIIEDNVIINDAVTILRLSHHVDCDRSFSTTSSVPLVIKSYSWIATGSVVLPSVSKISVGTILDAYAVLSRNTEEDLGVYVGNPAILVRKHSMYSDQLVVPRLRGGDFKYYYAARFNNKGV